MLVIARLPVALTRVGFTQAAPAGDPHRSSLRFCPRRRGVPCGSWNTMKHAHGKIKILKKFKQQMPHPWR